MPDDEGVTVEVAARLTCWSEQADDGSWTLVLSFDELKSLQEAETLSLALRDLLMSNLEQLPIGGNSKPKLDG